MMKSYAQLDQDLLILYFFTQYSPTPKIFLDVGAFDGISFSNTRLFFEQEWSGVCVEPVLKNYRKLENLYRGTNVSTVRAAVTNHDGEMVLNVATIPWAKEWGSDVSSLGDEVLKLWPDYVWEKEIVPAMTVNGILEKCKVGNIDFVSIDVEGQEMAVLMGFDLQKYRPQLIIVEYSSEAEEKELKSYLRHQGYFCWSNNGQDLFMVNGTPWRYLRILPKGLWQTFKYSKIMKLIFRNVERLNR